MFLLIVSLVPRNSVRCDDVMARSGGSRVLHGLEVIFKKLHVG